MSDDTTTGRAKDILHNAWAQGGFIGVVTVAMLGAGAYMLYVFVPVWRDNSAAESKARIEHAKASSDSIHRVAAAMDALVAKMDRHAEVIESKISLALRRR